MFSHYSYTVSVVVCYHRNYTLSTGSGVNPIPAGLPNGEKTASVQFVGGGLAGGDVLLTQSVTGVPLPLGVKENDWIALCGPLVGSKYGVCRWFRVVSVGDFNQGDTSQYLSLNGPDCTDWAGLAAGSVTAISIDKSVVGVYTTTMEVDRDPLW
jgi:hypothetical protein